MGDARRGQKRTEEQIRRIVAVHVGAKRSVESREKMRLAAISRILKNGQTLSVGRNEKAILDAQEVFRGVVIRRQVVTPNGYVLDGYCDETNTAFEVYEKHHRFRLREDVQRELEIRAVMGCELIVLWEEHYLPLAAMKNASGETEYKHVEA